MPAKQERSLRDLLLAHELIFIFLILIAVISGGYGIYMWDKASKESQRINLIVQEIYQVRGDLYRQMKELFDAFFLQENKAFTEYDAYTTSVLAHFKEIRRYANDKEEQQAIAEIEENYRTFIKEAPALFYAYQSSPDSQTKQSLYHDIETGIFARYENVSKRAEHLLGLKQGQLDHQLQEAKLNAIFVLSIPVLLSILLLTFSRKFLRNAIITPINAIKHATTEISTGKLSVTVPEGGVKELAELSHDINRMAEDLATSRDALVRTEKQAAMGLLVPMLAHNIRNPLASIRATAQIADTPELDKDTRESLQGIMLTVDRLERWTGALLAYLHPIKPQLEIANIESIIRTVTLLLEPRILAKHITWELDIQQASERILTDEHLLEQVFYNLLLNAIEASPTQSKIRIEARKNAEHLTIRLSDQGPGMPFKPDPHATSPGPSTKRFGTGLGIPFAFKVCEVLGAHIAFLPQSPQGTQVELILPLSLDIEGQEG